MNYLEEDDYPGEDYEPYCDRCNGYDAVMFDDGYTVCSSCDGLDND